MKTGEGCRFYGEPDDKAVIFVLPFEPVAEALDEEYDLWLSTGRVLEHQYTDSVTRRVPELHRVSPEAVLFIYLLDAKAHDLCRGDKVEVVSHCGEVVSIVEMHGRNRPSQGLMYMPLFDAAQLANKLTLDAADPLLREADFKKYAVKLEKVQAIMFRSARPQSGRRRLLRDVVHTVDGLATVSMAPRLQQRTTRASDMRLCLPGAINENAPVSACARCSQCVQICPHDTLKPAILASGLSAGMPYSVARDIPCEICKDVPYVRVCPSGTLDREIKLIDNVRMRLTVLVGRENYLNLQRLHRDVCYRECPKIDKVITLELERNMCTGKHARFLPTVHSDACTDCGKCEKVCMLE